MEPLFWADTGLANKKTTARKNRLNFEANRFIIYLLLVNLSGNLAHPLLSCARLRIAQPASSFGDATTEWKNYAACDAACGRSGSPPRRAPCSEHSPCL